MVQPLPVTVNQATDYSGKKNKNKIKKTNINRPKTSPLGEAPADTQTINKIKLPTCVSASVLLVKRTMFICKLQNK